MHMHRNYDVVLCGGPGSVASFSEALDVDPASVLPLGLPRVDYLREAAARKEPASIARLRERYPRLADGSKRVVLYAPTFRWHGRSAFAEVIGAFGGSAFTLIVKPHDLESAALAGEHVVDATGTDVLDLLTLCDVVVTDYSAVAFEAACVEKPVYYFVYDIDEYRSGRGLNIDPLVEMPSVSSTRIEDLVGAITRLDYDPQMARTFRERYVPSRAHCSTASIADLVFEHLPSS
jgi:CDP-ribitol ribitolphosphotransferase / teichoic acid ribitol-phosphate polymerase